LWPCPRQQHPCGGEVAGWIAGEHFGEVDDARERSVRDDDVRGMEVAVHPHRRALPRLGRNGVIPDGPNVDNDVVRG
jgi:hypothetical protein